MLFGMDLSEMIRPLSVDFKFVNRASSLALDRIFLSNIGSLPAFSSDLDCCIQGDVPNVRLDSSKKPAIHFDWSVVLD